MGKHTTERVYLSAYRALTLKIGETFSLDRPYSHPMDAQEQIVAFDGKDEHGYFRWKRELDGRVFLYTLPQSQRLIYHVKSNCAAIAKAEGGA